MNKAYRLIWSKAREAWVIVAEIVKGNGGPPSVTVKAVVVAAAMSLIAAKADALPTGQQVVSGNATFAVTGNTLTVTNSPSAIINWQGFSIAAGERTTFIQQSAASGVLNRVIGPYKSDIFGMLDSNGKVFLINPNGIIFGAGSQVNVAGLVASSLGISNHDFLAGHYNFTAGSTAGAVRNQGAITTTAGGMVWLISPNVENSGVITTPSGSVMLAAGQSVNMVDPLRPEIAVVVSAPADQAVNIGSVLAQGGSAGIFGSLVSQQGVVSATGAAAGRNGRIFLKSTMNTTLGEGSVTTAGGVKGGSITIQSTTGDTFVSGSVSAGGTGGTGGSVKILGNRVALTGATVDASGATGGGSVLIGGDYRGKNSAVQNARETSVSTDSIITADALFKGNGGKAIVWSDGSTKAYGTLSARGGARGGNGGLIETSGHLLDFAGVRVDASAARGKAGMWLIDPVDMTIGLVEASNIVASLDNATPTNVTVTTSAAGPDQGNISVDSPVTWSSGASLTLTADSSVFVNAPIAGGGPLVITGNGTNSAPGTPGVSVSSPVSAASVTISGRGANGADCVDPGCSGGNGGNGVEITNSIFATGAIKITGFGGKGGSGVDIGGFGGTGIELSETYGSYINMVRANGAVTLKGYGGAGGSSAGGLGGQGGYGFYAFSNYSPSYAAIKSDVSVNITAFGGAGGIGGAGSIGGGYGVQDSWLGGEGAVMAPSAKVTAKGGINLSGTLDSVILNNSGSGDIIYTTADYGYNNGLVASGVNKATGGGFSVTDNSGLGLTVAGITTANGPVSVAGDADVTFTRAISAGTGDVTITAGNGAIMGVAGSSSINAGSATLTAANGIGTATPFKTAVSTLIATNSVAGIVRISNAKPLTVTNLNNSGGSITLDNVGAITLEGAGVHADATAPVSDITVTAHSPITINAPLTASGNITLNAGASGSLSDVLTVNSTVTAGGNVTLSAGETVVNGILGSTLFPGGNLNIFEHLNVSALTTQTAALLPGVNEAINDVVVVMGRESTDLSEEEKENKTDGGEPNGTEFKSLQYCN